MTLFSIIILALVQGITEFLPVSSSAHLILAHLILHPPETPEALQQNLIIDIAVHVGTLFSVLVYFRNDIFKMFLGIGDMLCGRLKAEGARLNLLILTSSIPVVIVGFAFYYFKVYWGSAVEVVAWTTLIFGILLWVADAKSPVKKKFTQMNFKHAFLIGCAQAIALIPGVSRSGICMTAGRFLGYSRPDAARYAMLIATVAMTGAGALGAKELIALENIDLTTDALAAGFFAFLAGLGTITFMMSWLQRASFKVFAVYRILLALGLLGAIYSGILPV